MQVLQGIYPRVDWQMTYVLITLKLYVAPTSAMRHTLKKGPAQQVSAFWHLSIILSGICPAKVCQKCPHALLLEKEISSMMKLRTAT